MHVMLAAGYIHLMQTTNEDDLSDILHRDVAIDLTHFHKYRCLKNDSLLAVNIASLTLSALRSNNSVHSYKSNFPRTGMSVLPRSAITLLDHNIPVLAILNG